MISANTIFKQNEESLTRNFPEIIENYDKLLKSTQDELNFYKDERERVKKEYLKLIKENEIIHQELANALLRETSDELGERHNEITEDVVENLKLQIRELTEERDSIYKLWKTSQVTINNLDQKINVYREKFFNPNYTEEIQKKYIDTIESLENTIKTLRDELKKQVNINNEVFSSKQEIEKKLQDFEVLCKNLLAEKEKISLDYSKLEKSNSCLKEQLNLMVRNNNELGNSLQIARAAIEERYIREKDALEKVQEALIVAEIAMAEKEKAICKEKVIREECDQLAETIGQIMEEAAKRVEKNVANLKLQYEEQIKNLGKSYQEIENQLDKQIKLSQLAEVKIKTLEKKLKDSLQENITLDTDLQVASQAIVEMELKLEALELLLEHDRKSYRDEDNKDVELRELLSNCENFKERWRSTIEEITKKFQQEILELQNENTSLKLENQELRLKIFN